MLLIPGIKFHATSISQVMHMFIGSMILIIDALVRNIVSLGEVISLHERAIYRLHLPVLSRKAKHRDMAHACCKSQCVQFMLAELNISIVSPIVLKLTTTVRPALLRILFSMNVQSMLRLIATSFVT